ncbi:MAG: MgtC/SapB family protein [Candidatus Polarisedimenticolia bacterium]
MQDVSRFFLEDGLRLGLAVLMGGVIGLERQASDKPAGLRTHILICVGSTLMMILSIDVPRHYGVTAADPGRIAQGVITGIGFLGAGTILHSRGGVTGLTTAATTWSVAGIGLALGSGFYMLAGITTVLILGVLWALGRLSWVWANGKNRSGLRVMTDGSESAIEAVREVFLQEGIQPLSWDLTRGREGMAVTVECALSREALPRLVTRLASVPQVRRTRTI